MPGPLHGLKVVEMVGLGPAPFCAMVLADLGAEVLRVDRPRTPGTGATAHVLPADPRFDLLARGRSTLAIDLKRAGAVDDLMAVLERADAVIEGFRPGTMERLGLGPDACLERNPRLVYGRMTGWGQDGPLAQTAGHDIDYIAVSGALHAIGPRDGEPTVPLNIVGDFGGGAMLLAVGVLAALLEAKGSGRGQVVDAAMVDGAALLSTMLYGFAAYGWWNDRRGTNLLDGGAHFYRTYRCADGKYVAVGAIEPQFYATLRERCELDRPVVRRANGSGCVAGADGEARGRLRDPHARRLVRAARGQRRLRRAGPRPYGGADASASAGARHVRRRRRGRAAGAGAALRPDAGSPAAVARGTAACRRRPHRVERRARRRAATGRSTRPLIARRPPP